MVDPKRNINILSEEGQLFLNECEEEFKDRFTEEDAEFRAYCAQPSAPPPVLEPWQTRNYHGGAGDRRHDGGGGRGRGRFQYHHHNRNRDRPYNQSGQHGNRYGSNTSRDYNNRDNNNPYNSDRRY